MGSPDDGDPVPFAQGVGGPLGAGHHFIVHGHGQAALVGQGEVDKELGQRLGVRGFLGRIVYVADHGNRKSWRRIKSINNRGDNRRKGRRATDTFPFAGISRGRFKGYALSPGQPDTPKVYTQIYALPGKSLAAGAPGPAPELVYRALDAYVPA
ncbi:MAG: hypothetical protein NVSMB30_14000 [Hymenobacter sp.]